MYGGRTGKLAPVEFVPPFQTENEIALLTEYCGAVPDKGRYNIRDDAPEDWWHVVVDSASRLRVALREEQQQTEQRHMELRSSGAPLQASGEACGGQHPLEL